MDVLADVGGGWEIVEKRGILYIFWFCGIHANTHRASRGVSEVRL
jgi:hypothetical protein